MIPRPKSDAAVRHNPGRWICNTRPERCNGYFAVYGQLMACPLRAKCFWGRKNTYEWSPGPKISGRFAELDIDSTWRRKHGNRLAQLQQLFAPELRRRVKTPEQKERYAQKEREARQAKANARPVGSIPKRPLLPCGEDCDGGCPYDGPCPYTDADIEALEAEAKREKARRQSAEKYQRQKARMAVDPVYAEKFRAGNRRRNKAAYDRNPEKYRERAREAQRKKRQQKRKG